MTSEARIDLLLDLKILFRLIATLWSDTGAILSFQHALARMKKPISFRIGHCKIGNQIIAHCSEVWGRSLTQIALSITIVDPFLRHGETWKVEKVENIQIFQFIGGRSIGSRWVVRLDCGCMWLARYQEV